MELHNLLELSVHASSFNLWSHTVVTTLLYVRDDIKHVVSSSISYVVIRCYYILVNHVVGLFLLLFPRQLKQTCVLVPEVILVMFVTVYSCM